MDATTLEAGIVPASSWYIQRVKTKLATGVYQTEPVACFCGSTSAQLVTDKDRYGFDHAMWLCKDCGVIYANPRMTEASYAQFYAEEYRAIYDAHEEHGVDSSVEAQFTHGQQAALALQTYFQDIGQIQPSVVFDIGCNAGGWLKPFFDAGAEVHGVDYGPERISDGRKLGLPLQVGSIETLEVMGRQADLIILNHVLEHATDIASMLRRVRGLLKDDGLLYIALPGLFAYDLHTLFQNAHPWQFTAETLTYVMECCGFEELRADQHITSVWKKSPDVRAREDRPTRSVRDVANYLFRNGQRVVPLLRTDNKFPLADRRAAIASATSRGLPEITDLIHRHDGGSAVIVGGGPSIEAQIDTIRRLQAAGCLVLSIERMYPWCQSHGITPDYVIAQDASDDVIEAFTVLAPGSTYLLSTQCQPAVFEILRGESVYFFHTVQRGIPQEALTGPTNIGVQVNSGGSVVLCSLSLAMLLGLADVHLFGFDCHTTAGGYATGIAGVGEQTDTIQVRVEDRIFTTTPAYLAFAQQFFLLKDQGERDGLLASIKVYGDSLVLALSPAPQPLMPVNRSV